MSTQTITRLLLVSLIVSLISPATLAQSPSWSERMAATVMTLWKNSWSNDPARAERWSYEQGVALKGMEDVWLNTGDGKYFNFIQQSIDRFVSDDGTIKTYRIDEYNLDNINEGKLLLTLYRVIEKEK